MALAKGTPILVGGRKCFEFVHEMVLVQPDPDSYFLHKPTHPQDFYEIMFFSREREIALDEMRCRGRGEWTARAAALTPAVPAILCCSGSGRILGLRGRKTGMNASFTYLPRRILSHCGGG
ncbi:MAG: hypothetical protein ACLTDS_14040 [Bianqueaceae bacterium]